MTPFQASRIRIRGKIRRTLQNGRPSYMAAYLSCSLPSFQVILFALVGCRHDILALVMILFYFILLQDPSMLLLKGSPLSPHSVSSRFSMRR
jgi:hypothetical protein